MEIEFFDIETLAEIKLYLYTGVVNAILVHVIIPFENSNKIPVLQR